MWVLGAGALLAIGTLSVWRYEIYRHRITLAPTDTIVLADVDNRTGDPVFDDALNNALRYEMEQTPYLNLLGPDKTYATLGQLKLPPTTKITPDIARQLCSETNSKVVIADAIADAGNRPRYSHLSRGQSRVHPARQIEQPNSMTIFRFPAAPHYYCTSVGKVK